MRFRIPLPGCGLYFFFFSGLDLFTASCLFTGRYKDGDVDPDPKTWKANFRCAMNSLPDIQEVKDQSISRGPGAIRVYKMLKPPVKLEKKGIAQNEGCVLFPILAI